MTGPRTVAVVYGHRLDVGGVETHLLSLMGRTDPSRWRWRVLSGTSAAFAQRARRTGAAVDDWAPRSAIDARAAAALHAALRAAPPDILHVHHPRSLLAARIAGLRLSLPVVYTVHLPLRPADVGGMGGGVRQRLYAMAEDLVLRLAPPARVIHVSARAQTSGASAGRRTVVVRNGVDLSRRGDPARRSTLRADLGASPDDIVILAVARLVAQKGLDVLIDAVARLEDRPRVWVAGEGPLRAALEARAARQPGTHAIRFLGARGDVPDLLQAADVFVLPSRRETTPLALLEAMAAGRACVATDVGDCAELLAEGAGRIVPPDDAAALAAALSDVGAAAHREARGAAAARRARLFGDAAMARRTEEIYEAVLAEHAALRVARVQDGVPSTR